MSHLKGEMHFIINFRSEIGQTKSFNKIVCSFEMSLLNIIEHKCNICMKVVKILCSLSYVHFSSVRSSERPGIKHFLGKCQMDIMNFFSQELMAQNRVVHCNYETLFYEATKFAYKCEYYKTPLPRTLFSQIRFLTVEKAGKLPDYTRVRVYYSHIRICILLAK